MFLFPVYIQITFQNLQCSPAVIYICLILDPIKRSKFARIVVWYCLPGCTIYVNISIYIFPKLHIAGVDLGLLNKLKNSGLIIYLMSSRTWFSHWIARPGGPVFPEGLGQWGAYKVSVAWLTCDFTGFSRGSIGSADSASVPPSSSFVGCSHPIIK